MAGIDKSQVSRSRLELGNEQRDKTVRGSVLGEVFVDRYNGLIERRLCGNLSVDRRVEARHQQCGGSSLTRNITKCYEHRVIVAFDKIVIVTPDLIARERDALELITLDDRRACRLEPLL